MSRGLLKTGVMLALALALPSAGALRADGPVQLSVDCARGQSLSQALGIPPRPLVVEFMGTCTGDVEIPGNDITLRGADSSATIIGTVTMVGRSRVTLEGFTVRDTPVGNPITRIGDGIVALRSQDINLKRMSVINAGNISIDIEGSTVDITDLTVSRSRNIGLAVALGSVVEIFGTASVSEGSNNGIMVTDKGQIQVSPRATVSTTDNAGSGLFVQMQGHVTIHGGARVTSSRNGSGINVVDHGNVIYGGSTIEISNNRGFGLQVGQLADWTIFAGVVPNLKIVNNGGAGLLISRQAFVRLRENTMITGNAGPGLVVDGAGIAMRGTTIQGNNNGNGDVVLVFGANATFDGGDTVGTPIFCDGTPLVRGTLACGSSLTAAQAAAAAVPAEVPEPGPEPLRPE